MEELLSALRAAGEPTRVRILGLLGHGELTVSELTRILCQSQPRVSRHLRLLCDAGLLERYREGAWVFYRLVQDGSNGHLARTIVDLLPDNDDELQRDLERLARVRDDRAAEAAAYFQTNAANWDRLRSLYVPEEEVERHLLSLVHGKQIDSLLDIGTGTGRILEIFADRIGSGLGYDLSTEMLNVARSRLMRPELAHCQVRLGDMYDLPAPNASQDLVVLHQVLHFANDPARAIEEAGRVLRPDGQALVVDFTPHDKEFLREEHAHRRLGFADEEVIGWARAADLDCISVTHLNGAELTVGIWTLAKATDASATEITAALKEEAAQ